MILTVYSLCVCYFRGQKTLRLIKMLAFEPAFKGGAVQRRQRFFNHLQNHGDPQIFHERMLYDGGAVGFATMQTATRLGHAKEFYIKLGVDGLATASDFGVKSKDPCYRIKLERTVAVPLQPQ